MGYFKVADTGQEWELILLFHVNTGIAFLLPSKQL